MLLLFSHSFMSNSLQLRYCSTSGFPDLHYLPKFAQTYVHWVDDAIQQSNPLSPPFSFCLQSFWALCSFPMSQLFASGGQNIGTPATVFPKIIQCWFPLALTGLLSLLSKGLTREKNTCLLYFHILFLNNLYNF